ncbi:MAG: NADH-quinone oxidoreductase subunit J [Gammaproteobacteria bacterium]|nr:NADH-quinone oxidoreductase subunit J [Gammaproteobacteria bacterium]MCP5137742.1 NADH-quinone oxidoreductase subunit J [Gammaproteobacteria bacterium]
MNAIVLPVVLPLLAAFLLPSLARIWSSAARVLGPVLMLVSLCVLWTTWGEHPTPFVVALGGFQPPMGIAFHVDSVAMLFAFLVAGGALLMWPAWTDDDTMPRLAALTLLLVAAATGLALSGDLFNVYVFYELLSVASFGLVSARRTGAAFAAGFRYLVISGFGSVLALLGIALIYLRTGTLNIAHLGQLAPESLADPFGLAAFALLLLGFGVKAELFPVNTWVPEVYAGSSARVAGLLAGVVSKLAVLVVVRMLVVVFPHDETRMLLLILGVVGVLSGELAAWSAKDMRRMLAFSSIGQLGMIFIAFSIPGEAGWVAGLALVLHHLVVKSGLFLIADRWGGALQSLTGAARVSPFTAGLFVLFALSLIGVPPLPGFWAKLQLVIGLVENGNGVYLGALLVFLAATVIEANYLFRLAVAMYAEGASSTVTAPSGGNRIGAAIFAAVLVAAVFLLNPLSEAIDDLAVVGNDATGYMDSLAGGAR